VRQQNDRSAPSVTDKDPGFQLAVGQDLVLSLVQDGLTGCEDTIERDLNESELRQLIERPMGVTSDRPVDSYGEPAWRERLTASLVGDPAISDAVDEAIEQSRNALITEAEQLLEEAARATSAESVAYREMATTALRRVGFIVTAANEFIHVTVSNPILGFVVVITLLVECAGDILSDRERPTRSR
jgi:hypothetical protein